MIIWTLNNNSGDLNYGIFWYLNGQIVHYSEDLTILFEDQFQKVWLSNGQALALAIALLAKTEPFKIRKFLSRFQIIIDNHGSLYGFQILFRIRTIWPFETQASPDIRFRPPLDLNDRLVTLIWFCESDYL